MQFQNIEEKVIYEKLIRMSSSWQGEGPADVLEERVPELCYPACLPEAEARERLQGILESRKDMRKLQDNPADRDALTDRGGPAGRLLGLLRQVARKLFLRWYVAPVAEQQTEFNVASTRTVDGLFALSVQMIQGMAEQEEMLSRQAERIEALSSELAACRDALAKADDTEPSPGDVRT